MMVDKQGQAQESRWDEGSNQQERLGLSMLVQESALVLEDMYAILAGWIDANVERSTWC